jgi:hypothetical protein
MSLPTGPLFALPSGRQVRSASLKSEDAGDDRPERKSGVTSNSCVSSPVVVWAINIDWRGCGVLFAGSETRGPGVEHGRGVDAVGMIRVTMATGRLGDARAFSFTPLRWAELVTELFPSSRSPRMARLRTVAAVTEAIRADLDCWSVDGRFDADGTGMRDELAVGATYGAVKRADGGEISLTMLRCQG